MMTSWNGNIFRVTGHFTGEFPAQRPVTRNIDVFFDLRLNRMLRKQWWDWWLETPSHPLWRHWNEVVELPVMRRDIITLFKAPCPGCCLLYERHYNDVIMSTIASQITSLTTVYSTVYSGIDQRKHQSSASLAFVRGIHRGPVNSPHKGPVTRKMFPFDDVIMALHWSLRILRWELVNNIPFR